MNEYLKRILNIWDKYQFSLLLSFFHVCFIILIAIFGRYPTYQQNDESEISTIYPMLADVHVMVFIGFGFLMTFLKRYGFSAVSVNLLLASFSIVWSIIIRGFLSKEFSQYAAVVLISMGAMLGKLSPSQYLIMAFLEIPAAMILEHVITELLFVADIGGSLVIHIMGCFFGLGVARIMERKGVHNSNNESSVYHSDLFAILGTLALWIYWISFNAALADGEDGKRRSIANTYLSLIGATIATFVTSNLVSKNKEFNMIHIANSTLAGGVAIVIGTIAGFISVIGYVYITPVLANRAGLHDTCGVLNLHGFPGLVSGICGIIFAFIYTQDYYRNGEYNLLYPGTLPENGGRTSNKQALYQFIGLVIALFGSLIAGLLSGIVLRLPIWNKVPDEELFSDGLYFHTPEDYDFITKVAPSIKTLDSQKISNHVV